MTRYELCLQKEVMSEQAADVIGDIMRYIRRCDINIRDNSNPIIILFQQVYKAKEDILSAKDEKELERISGKIEMAKDFMQCIDPVAVNA